MDSPVVESRLSQPFNSSGPDGRRSPTQLFRESAERPITRFQARLAPVASHLVHEPVCHRVVVDSKVGDLGPEVVGMGVNSIVASVGL